MPRDGLSSDRVRIVGVARAIDFSTSTVLIVLNKVALSHYVAAATKEQIRAIAAQFGYRPDA